MVRVRATDAILELDHVLVDGRSYRVLSVQRERDEFLLALEGVVDRDEADALRGSRLAVERAELPPLAECEVYVADLVGCQVVDRDGRSLGVVVSTFPSGAHELLRVVGEDTDFLLPLVEPIVHEVDLEGRRIVCDPPPGLLEL
jgi:16S rRNA processing protein RimM